MLGSDGERQIERARGLALVGIGRCHHQPPRGTAAAHPPQRRRLFQQLTLDDAELFQLRGGSAFGAHHVGIIQPSAVYRIDFPRWFGAGPLCNRSRCRRLGLRCRLGGGNGLGCRNRLGLDSGRCGRRWLDSRRDRGQGRTGRSGDRHRCRNRLRTRRGWHNRGLCRGRSRTQSSGQQITGHRGQRERCPAKPMARPTHGAFDGRTAFWRRAGIRDFFGFVHLTSLTRWPRD